MLAQRAVQWCLHVFLTDPVLDEHIAIWSAPNVSPMAGHPAPASRRPSAINRCHLAAMPSCLLAVSESYDLMWDARVDKLRAITEQAVSIAAELERQVEPGGLSRDQAIQRFRDAIRPSRYDGGAGYYFAYDMNANTLVLGPTPQAEGTNRIEMKDADGKLFLQALIAAARQGGGTVTYRYPKPGSQVRNQSSPMSSQSLPGTCLLALACTLMTCERRPWRGS